VPKSSADTNRRADAFAPNPHDGSVFQDRRPTCSDQPQRSAEYREALRELREKTNAKHPERAVYDAIFKLRDAREYVRAVCKASADEHSFVPEHRKLDVVEAVRDLALGAIEAIEALGVNDPSLSTDALAMLANHLQPFNRTKIASGFSGVVIDAEI
jgi:hypothetical protein